MVKLAAWSGALSYMNRSLVFTRIQSCTMGTMRSQYVTYDVVCTPSFAQNFVRKNLIV